MCDATQEEQEIIYANIEKIASPTGINFGDYCKGENKMDAHEIIKEWEAQRKNFGSITMRLDANVKKIQSLKKHGKAGMPKSLKLNTTLTKLKNCATLVLIKVIGLTLEQQKM